MPAQYSVDGRKLHFCANSVTAAAKPAQLVCIIECAEHGKQQLLADKFIENEITNVIIAFVEMLMFSWWFVTVKVS